MDSEIKRITVAKVRKILSHTGFSLVKNITLDLKNRCGCPIGVIAFSLKGQAYGSIMQAIDAVGLDRVYAAGFVAGFDEDDMYKTPERCEYWLMGCEDGQTVREELLNVN